MAETEDFEFFRCLLDRAVRARVEGVEVLSSSLRVEAPFSWKIERPALAICLGGTQSLVMAREGRIVELEQGVRDGFVMVPGCWLGARREKPYESLQIRFNPDSTHFFHKRLDEGYEQVPGAREINTQRIYHSPGQLDARGHEIYHLLLSPPPVGQSQYRRGLFEALLCKAREALTALPGGGKAHQTWRGACHFIEEHCEQPLTRARVAQFLNLHPNYLSQLFAAHGQESFSEFLLRVRLERARRLLQTPGLNVAEVARLSGFADANYFGRVFKQRYSTTPGRARHVA